MTNDTDVLRKISELETLAEEILRLKQKSLPRRPIVIEVCGSPKSGKTSCINSLSIFLRRNEFRVKTLVERAGVCPIRDKFDPTFNVWTACSALTEFAEVISNKPRDFDVVIMDRGLFDALCWFTWQRRTKRLDPKHFNLFVEFFTARKWMAKIDLVYVFKAEPNISLQREYATLLTRKEGSIMKPTVLEAYNKAIDSAWRRFGIRFRQIRSVDTSSMDQNAVSYQVTNDILEALRDLVAERIGHVPLSKVRAPERNVFGLSELGVELGDVEFENRSGVENDAQAVQFIPAVVITNKGKDKVVVGSKQRKVVGEASPERNKRLFYFGGHVRLEDRQRDVHDLNDLFACTASRELKEEIGVDLALRGPPRYCIWDRSDARSAKHIAVIYEAAMDLDNINLSYDNNEFSEKGVTILSKGDFLSQDLVLESWSQQIVSRTLGWHGPLFL